MSIKLDATGVAIMAGVALAVLVIVWRVPTVRDIALGTG